MQPMQKGVVGISVFSYWIYPLTNFTLDLEATQRYKDFLFGWILEPLVFGDYPEVMKKNVGSRLPHFTKVQSELIKGSLDFIGINHYYSLYVNDHPLETGVRDYYADLSVYSRGSRTDPSASQGVPTTTSNDPKGLHRVLKYLQETYGNFPIYVQENGVGSADDSLDDTGRIAYLSSYIQSTLDALRNGVNVRGYFAWAFMDLFELTTGYQSRYGLYRVDFSDERRPRQARLSARWYSRFLKHTGSSTSLPRTQENQALNAVS